MQPLGLTFRAWLTLQEAPIARLKGCIMDSPMLSSVVLPIMASSSTALILGGGVFGLTSALELRSRGWQVTLLDAGVIPHPDAASTDINKVIRIVSTVRRIISNNIVLNFLINPFTLIFNTLLIIILSVCP